MGQIDPLRFGIVEQNAQNTVSQISQKQYPQNVDIVSSQAMGSHGLADELAGKFVAVVDQIDPPRSKAEGDKHKTRNENGQFAPSGQIDPTVNKESGSGSNWPTTKKISPENLILFQVLILWT